MMSSWPGSQHKFVIHITCHAHPSYTNNWHAKSLMQQSLKELSQALNTNYRWQLSELPLSLSPCQCAMDPCSLRQLGYGLGYPSLETAILLVASLQPFLSVFSWHCILVVCGWLVRFSAWKRPIWASWLYWYDAPLLHVMKLQQI